MTHERKRKRTFELIRDLLLVSLVVPALFVLSFGSALLQEKDTSAIIMTAARMQLTGSDRGKVGTSDQRWLIRADNLYAPLDDYLKKRGWTRVGQKGQLGVYKRDGQPLYVRFKKYSGRYFICQADREP